MKSQVNQSRRAALGLMVVGVTAGMFSGSGELFAADKKNDTDTAGPLELDLFDAISQEKVEVNLVPNGSRQCKIVMKNRSDRPLRLKMPETFAGVPQTVYSQWDMGGGMGMSGGPGGDLGGSGSGGRGGRNSGGMGGNSGGQQSFGGGMGGGMGGMGGMGGGGMYNIAAERTESIVVPTVCLEHGKAEPRSNGKYKLFPLETVSEEPVVSEICKALCAGEVDQRTAQAAAWYSANGMSWEELSSKQVQRAFGVRYSYFSASEIQGARALVLRCEQIVAAREAAAKAAAKKSSSDSESGM